MLEGVFNYRKWYVQAGLPKPAHPWWFSGAGETQGSPPQPPGNSNVGPNNTPPDRPAAPTGPTTPNPGTSGTPGPSATQPITITAAVKAKYSYSVEVGSSRDRKLDLVMVERTSSLWDLGILWRAKCKSNGQPTDKAFVWFWEGEELSDPITAILRLEAIASDSKRDGVTLSVDEV